MEDDAMGSLKPESEVDPTKLAALLDGRLTGDERRLLLARLAASEEWSAVYADAIAALGAEQPPAGDVRPFAASARSWRWSRGGQFLTAAASIAVILVGAYWMLNRRPAAGDPVTLAVGELAAPDQGLFAGWEERGWSAVRGSGVPLSDAARAARVGALSVDLDLASRSGDTAARALAGEIAELLRDLPASAPIVRLYNDIAAGTGPASSDNRDAVLRARQAAAALLDSAAFANGVRGEAGRIAASRQDEGFFISSEGRALAEAAGARTDLAAEAKSTITRASVSTDGTMIDWQALTGALHAFSVAITR